MAQGDSVTVRIGAGQVDRSRATPLSLVREHSTQSEICMSTRHDTLRARAIGLRGSHSACFIPAFNSGSGEPRRTTGSAN